MENSKKIQALDDELLEHVGGGRGFFNWLFDGWEENVEIAAPTSTPQKRICPGSLSGVHEYGPPDAMGKRHCRYCNEEKN